jgi:SP family galactose:H+ symporter-like MFS transporter
VLGKIGGVATFSIFPGLAAQSLAFVWKYAPETKGRPLDSIPSFWRNGGRWDTPPTVGPVPPAADRAA